MSKDSEELKSMLRVFGYLSCVLFILFTAYTYFRCKKKYYMDYASARVQEATAFTTVMPQVLLISGILLFHGYITITIFGNCKSISDAIFGIIMLIPLIFLVVFGVTYAARMATLQIGVLIFQNNDAFVIPSDTYNIKFLDYFKLKWFRDMQEMEVLRLSQIAKITRGANGKMLYVHGTFGTRGIAWKDKQKREECIYALQIACRRQLTDTIAYD